MVDKEEECRGRQKYIYTYIQSYIYIRPHTHISFFLYLSPCIPYSCPPSHDPGPVFTSPSLPRHSTPPSA